MNIVKTALEEILKTLDILIQSDIEIFEENISIEPGKISLPEIKPNSKKTNHQQIFYKETEIKLIKLGNIVFDSFMELPCFKNKTIQPCIFLVKKYSLNYVSDNNRHYFDLYLKINKSFVNTSDGNVSDACEQIKRIKTNLAELPMWDGKSYFTTEGVNSFSKIQIKANSVIDFLLIYGNIFQPSLLKTETCEEIPDFTRNYIHTPLINEFKNRLKSQ